MVFILQKRSAAFITLPKQLPDEDLNLGCGRAWLSQALRPYECIMSEKINVKQEWIAVSVWSGLGTGQPERCQRWENL